MKTIGVVDDDASILRALRRLLGMAGFAVRTFTAGADLLGSDELDRLDCLILDVHLAGVTGFEVQDRLAESGRSIPIVFITAHDDPATRERAHQDGTSQYLRKPFDERALLRALETALREH